MNRFSVPSLGLALFLAAPFAHSQTNTNPNQSLNRMAPHDDSDGAMAHDSMGHGDTKAVDPLPQFSGNIPSSVNEDRTHGVNAPGTMIGPAPENGQPDPRFPGDKSTAGGGQEINQLSPSSGAAQMANGADKQSGLGQTGGTISNLNEGLPSASIDNSGRNSGGASGGTGGGAGGKEYNVGGDARPGVGASQSSENPTDVGRETAGAAPYAIGAGAVIIGAFLLAMMRARAKRRI